MEFTEKNTNKMLKKIMEIVEVDSFHITLNESENVDLDKIKWELSSKFYFDNLKEVDNFKEGLSQLFEKHFGDVNVETFNQKNIM